MKRIVSLVSTVPARLYLRAGDAVHLTTSQDISESEIWTNDRHLLAAAPHFGLQGSSV
jgi:predicted nucleic acid-binding protein